MTSPNESPQYEPGVEPVDQPTQGPNDDYYSQEDIELTKNTNEAPVWNILPSYQMYTNTIYKSLNVSDEDIAEPPSYENSSISSGQLSNISTRPSNALAHVPPSSQTSATDTNNSSQRLIIADESGLWQETVLDNIHKLTNLTHSNKVVSNSVKISVKFTKDVGELGKVPVLIDPLLHEYKQGDLINGYVLITNESNEPIPFDMFYVLFEGNFTVANTTDMEDTKPVKIKNFLQMFDFSASWNHAHINRLITEYNNPYDCPLMKDPIDNTALAIGKERKLLPGIKYKRFFTFKIPENLLDSECCHSLQEHTHVPPTLALSRKENFLNSIENRGENVKTKDFSFVGTSISYEVQARFIGRGSMYNVRKPGKSDRDTLLINSKGDEYVILKEFVNFLRVVPQTKRLSDAEKILKKKGNEMIYKNLVNRAKEKIEIGHELLEAIDTNKMDTAIDLVNKLSNYRLSKFSDQVKLRQLYNCSESSRFKKSLSKEESVENYNLVLPYTRKSITGTLKPMGTLQVLTPKVERILKYIPPKKFRREQPASQSDLNSWKLRVPVDLTYHIPHSLSDKGKQKLPVIKSIRSDLVVHLLKSDNGPIPIEITHDLLFKNEVHPNGLQDNKLQDLDEFSTIVKDQFKEYYSEIGYIFRKLPPDTFKVECELLRDIKCLSTIKEKKMNLQIEDVEYQAPGKQQLATSSKNLAQIEWTNLVSDEQPETSDTKQLSYNCKFDVVLDLVTAHLKVIGKFNKANSFDSFYLVPSFQLCSMVKIYYVKIDITLSSGDVVHLKVPVDFEK